ncbi:MAG: flavin reductase family protein [Bosea sp. (in: a-proteobacteria)]|uniref:flavin reductase family protein n=1 Tax=Bosea sp. (in: a-proteobacteria) TaxID=1871050 RepID=UPI002734C16F|nr:flavin reductase family protein [Bosea sp. (in: a-proteobacteria)]MDP3257961.1 flavin reductase family protein [Bosea sp. (in: a-proteobacteria)]MDP3320189.1 flavin reductase family protein [Bosea sp. (in: a-proteobacteria)]
MTEALHPLPRATPETASFRDAMSRVVSAVHVVTTRGAEGRAGLTATAVASVSDSPPTVLVCIARPSRTLAVIEAAGLFCINTLPGDALDLAEIFASRRGIEGEARFATRDWRALVTGAPVLSDAVAAFDCRLTAIQDVATHRILFGEVVGLGGAAAAPGSSLIYRQRGFEAV